MHCDGSGLATLLISTKMKKECQACREEGLIRSTRDKQKQAIRGFLKRPRRVGQGAIQASPSHVKQKLERVKVAQGRRRRACGREPSASDHASNFSHLLRCTGSKMQHSILERSALTSEEPQCSASAMRSALRIWWQAGIAPRGTVGRRYPFRAPGSSRHSPAPGTALSWHAW